MGSTLDQVGGQDSRLRLFTRPCSPRRSAAPRSTPDRIAKALAQFIRAMVSYQSKYDEGIAARVS